MAKRDRVRKLAKRLGVDPAVAIRTLGELGEARYKSPADMIPDDIARRLEEALTLAGLVREPSRPLPAKPSPPAEVAEPLATPQPASPEAEAAEEVASTPDPSLSSSPFAELADVAVESADRADEPPTEADVADLGAKLKALTVENGELRAQVRDAEVAWRAHDAGRKEATAQCEELEGRLSSARADFATAKRGRERDRAEHKVRTDELQAEVEAARTTPLRDIFEGRGMTEPAEFAQALAFLLRQERSGPTVRSLRVAGPDKFAEKLRERVMLWCGDEECRSDHPQDARVEVSPPARCEACKGKTIRRAAARFVEVCRDKNVERVTIAGGTPKYRTAIQEAIGHTLDVRVALNGERNGSQAVSDVEHSDLVIVWVSSEVDHKFTGLYTDIKDDKVVICSPRGISSMLNFASERVAGAPALAPQPSPV